MNDLVLREMDGFRSLEELRGPWADLASRLGDPSPFLCPEFLLPQIRWVQARYECRVLTAWSGDRLVGLAPLFRRTVSKWGLAFRVLSFPVHGTPPPFDLLIDPSAGGVLDAFVAHWRRRPDWDLLELSNVSKTSPTRNLLREVAGRASLALEVTHSRYGHHVPIQGTWDEYLRSRSKNLRSNYNRAWRRCREVGETRIVRFPDEETDLERALASVFRVLDRSWKRPPESASSQRTFFTELARELHGSAMLVIRTLFVGDEPLAYLLDIDHRRRFTAFHTAYALDAQDLWAGVLVLGDGVLHAHERQYECYDFAGEARLHITQWADHQSEFEDLCLASPRVLSRLKVPLYRAVRSRRRARSRQEAELRKASARKAAATVESGSRI